jgi:ribosome-binding protein aMBF1 (putative translation factor)
MADHDWTPVIIRGSGKNIDKEKERKGETERHTKFDGTHSSAMRKLDTATDVQKPQHINPKISAMIVKKRTEKKLTQKQLAQQVNILVPLLQQYENGKVKADVNILRKMERVLGNSTKLTGKDYDGINL